jgi:hypothetical protein
MRCCTGFALSCLFGLASCSVEVPDLDDNTFACQNQGDCADGFVCNSSLGRCLKSCSEQNDCPPTAPMCSDGVCADACTAKGCFRNGQACTIDNGVATCKECNLVPDKSCGVAGRVCVVKSSSADSMCAAVSTCTSGDKSDCSLGGSDMGKCVEVTMSGQTQKTPVCVRCPTCTGSTCVAAAGVADSYNGATTCGSTACTTTSDQCSDVNQVCVRRASATDPYCVSKCTTPGMLCTDGTGLCVKVQSGTGSQTMLACTACPSACTDTCVDSDPTTAAHAQLAGATACQTVCDASNQCHPAGTTVQCTDLGMGYTSGSAACSSSCQWDTTQCTTCGGMSCNPNTEACIQNNGNPMCMPTCSPVGASCAPTGRPPGWCVTVLDTANAPQPTCVPCGTAACANPTNTCMVFGGASFSNLDDAKAHAVCSCPPAANGWYAVGTSGCADGTSWTGVAFEVSSPGDRGLSVALGDTGVPYVAFTDSNPAAQVLAWDPIVAAWNAAGLTSTVSAVSGGGSAQQPVVAFMSGGTAPAGLRVAWSELNAASRRQIYLARLDPSTRQWGNEGVNSSGWGSNGGDGISNLPNNDGWLPALTLNPSGSHVVTWQDGQIRASQPQSGQWLELVATGVSSTLSTPGPYVSPQVAQTADATMPFVAWQSGASYTCISIRRYAASAWSGFTSTDDECPGVSQSSSVQPGMFAGIAMAGIEPVVVWQKGGATAEIRIRQHSAGGWKGFGTDTVFSQVSISGQSPAAPALAMIAGADPVVAYEAGIGVNARIVVRRWNSTLTTWNALGDSMLVNGISGFAGEAHNPSIVVGQSPHDPSRQAVCVAWTQMISGHSRPHLRCFDL